MNKTVVILASFLFFTGCSEVSLKDQIEGAKWKLQDYRYADQYFMFKDQGVIRCTEDE